MKHFVWLLMLCFALGLVRHASAEGVAWPKITQTAKPWTRWWWHGSAVDRENITLCLEEYAAAGLGGVEITCIYGVKGTDGRQLSYLSPEWLDAVTFAVEEAKRLGMGVDLPSGSGWRMGGPDVMLAESDAVWESTKPRAAGRLLGEKVKRPAPGGEGYTINPFSRDSVEHYLNDWGKKTASLPNDLIRASFQDSFEYDGDWSDQLLSKFAQARGYRLEDHWQELAGEGDPETVARVKGDYRETLSDLVLEELIVPWVEWSHGRGQVARNQAHGSPGNWLDLYAESDIPETESFGRLEDDDADPLIQKFASSAAHVAGKNLVAAETGTWLDEHFHVTLAELKERIDQQMLAGVNHVIYHGTAYSPAEAVWPGWLFYASTQLNPQNPIWRDFPALNAYVARCQAMLQAGEPSNDLLVYWPIHDVWHDAKGLRKDFRVHNSKDWFFNQPIGEAAEYLDNMRISFDYISDRQLQKCEAVGDQIKTQGSSYQAILIPDAKYLPTATLIKLKELAKAGGRVLFWRELPASPPGLLNEEKKREFAAAIADMGDYALVNRDLWGLIKAGNINSDTDADGQVLKTIRRRMPDGWCYFLKNVWEHNCDIRFAAPFVWESAVLMNPMTGEIGEPALKDGFIRVQLAPKETVFVRTFDHEVSAEPWQYQEIDGKPLVVDGEWDVRFVADGPELPEAFQTSRLATWTQLAGEAGSKFAGTAAYTISLPRLRSGRYLLDLGRVADSARVFLSGKELGVLFAQPFQIPIEITEANNTLTVEVTNVAANRIRDLDRRGVEWRIFEDINFVGIDYKPFDATNWPVREAGLLGPVTLSKLKD